MQFVWQTLWKWHHMNHQGHVNGIRSSSHLSDTSWLDYGRPQQQWMSLLIAQHPISLCWEGTQNLTFCLQFESPPQLNWHHVNHEELIDGIRSISRLFCTSNEDYETLQQQWIALFASHHPISWAKRVLKIWYFVGNLSDNLCGNDIIWTIRGM